MNKISANQGRRQFSKTTILAGAALASGATRLLADDEPKQCIRTGVIGCGSVSTQYLPILTQSPFVDVVSLCDIRPERARGQAEKYKIANHYPNIDARESSATGQRIALSSTFHWPLLT